MKRVIQILTSSALIISACLVRWHFGHNASTLAETEVIITIEQPNGGANTVGNGDDFATTVLGDPWDMSEPSDLLGRHHLPDATISNGELSLTAEDDRSLIKVLFPGKEGMVDVGNVGMNYPIDTSVYRWLSFRMYHPAADFKIKWFYGRYGDNDRPWAETEKMAATAGWHTYVIDLESAPIKNTSGGATGWEGMVPALDILSLAPTGSQVKIDWVRLTADNPTDNALDISWSGLRPVPDNLKFHLDTDTAGCDGPPIYSEGNLSTSGYFRWQQSGDGIASPANVAHGDYYVCARTDGTIAGYSSDQLTVNRSPIIHFTQPSYTSGNDYATETGNAWDMSDAADVDHVVQSSYKISEDVLVVTIPDGSLDSQVHLNVPDPIDSDRHYYLTYRLLFDYPFGRSAVGQNNRIFWGRLPNTETTSGLLYVYPGWMTYTIDLRSMPLYDGPIWETADWTLFRMDPIGQNKTGDELTVYIDDVKLTGDEEADAFSNIKWQLTDPDTSVTTMTLYYDDDQADRDGTHVATLSLTDGEKTNRTTSATEPSIPLHATEGLSETIYLPLVTRRYVTPCSGACYTWFTEDISPGAYYLYACIDDGHNRFCRYSETPLQIHH